MEENETMRTHIRNLHSSKSVKPRFCDFVIIDGIEYFEKKEPGSDPERIRADDFLYQYHAAKEIV